VVVGSKVVGKGDFVVGHSAKTCNCKLLMPRDDRKRSNSAYSQITLVLVVVISVVMIRTSNVRV